MRMHIVRQTEHANRHAKRQAKHAKQQIQYIDRQNEQNDKQTSPYVKWQATWKTHTNNWLLAKGQLNEHTPERIDWSNNMIKIIKKS
jgi:hypothetical protein